MKTTHFTKGLSIFGFLFLVCGPGPLNADPAFPVVMNYGCFARSGDGGDTLPGGAVAPIVPAGVRPWRVPCGLEWISDNASGFSSPSVPTVINLTRRFSLDPALVANGVFKVRFEADDAVEFRLNGQTVPVASCAPPPGNDGECQQSCHEVVIPASNFLAHPQQNVLEVKLTNLFSVPAGGSNYGWTGVSYELCVEPAAPVVTPTPVPTRVTCPIAYPNPSDGKPIRFKWGGVRPGDRVCVRIYTPSFREIHRSFHHCGNSRELEMSWDLRDDNGAPAANGFYHVQFENERSSRKENCKVLILR